MVCFCDIPLKFINQNHTYRYGHIGIGFTKDWGLKQKVNPVMYRIKESPIGEPFSRLIEETNSVLDRISKDYSSMRTNFADIDSLQSILGNARKITSFIKPYEEGTRNNYLDM